jgi:hypothetical protein
MAEMSAESISGRARDLVFRAQQASQIAAERRPGGKLEHSHTLPGSDAEYAAWRAAIGQSISDPDEADLIGDLPGEMDWDMPTV